MTFIKRIPEMEGTNDIMLFLPSVHAQNAESLLHFAQLVYKIVLFMFFYVYIYSFVFSI